MKRERLHKGLVVFNRSTGLKGTMIDWGVRVKYRIYLPLPAYNKMAEAVRVRTKSAIEIWPLEAVSFEKE